MDKDIKEIIINDGIKVYLWEADKSCFYPPSDDLLANFPKHYVERYQDSASELHKKQAMGSAILLYRELDIRDDSQFHIAPHGKIHLINHHTNERPTQISISHSKSTTALAVSNSSIGIDIEHIRKYNEKVVKRFFPNEFREELYASLAKLDPNNEAGMDESFTVFWTRLEASLKADGRGLSTPRKEIQSVLSSYRIKTEIIDNLIISVAFR